MYFGSIINSKINNNMNLLILLLVLGGIILYFVLNVKRKLVYWKERGFPQLNPHWIYGDAEDLINKRISAAEKERDLYFTFKEKGYKYGGFYFLHQPKLILVDPELIKAVLIKDFNNFSAHLPKLSSTLLFNNLFHFDGDLWKDWRRKLTPTFTSGKMKMMYNLVFEKTVALNNIVENIAVSNEPAEIKEILARFTTDVIGTCAFGIECNSLQNVDSIFFQKGQDIFRSFTNQKDPPNPFAIFLVNLGLINPIKFPDFSEIEDFFRSMVAQTVEYREKNKVFRKDFLQLMIQLKNQGTITDLVSENDIYSKSNGKDTLTIEQLAGQCLLFFSAGYETSSTTMSFALLELAKNQDVQDKLRKEIRDTLKRHDGVLSYDATYEMTYLENIIYEALRKYPPVPNLTRMCTQRYLIPHSNLVIEKGTLIEIPLLGVHYDPDYYPNPEKFLPERFQEKKTDITFLSFGEGPRQCLGLRFGMMQVRTGLASLINKFKFTLSPETIYPPKFSTLAPMLAVEGGIWLNAQFAE